MNDIIGVNVVQDAENTRYIRIPTSVKRDSMQVINVGQEGFSTVAVQNPTDYVMYFVRTDLQSAVGYSESLIAKIPPLAQQNFLVRNGAYAAFFSQIPCWPSAKKPINDIGRGPVAAPKNDVAHISLLSTILPPHGSASPDAKYTLIQPSVVLSAGSSTLYLGFYLRNALYPNIGLFLNNAPPNLLDPSSGLRPLPPLKKAWLTLTRQGGDTSLAGLNINAIRINNLAQMATVGAPAEQYYVYDGNLVSNADPGGGLGAISRTVLAVTPLTLPINVDLSAIPADYLSLGLTVTAGVTLDVSLALQFDSIYWPYE